MDEIAGYNQARWKALAEADALFTRPNLNLNPDSARKLVDPDGRFGDVSGKDVLCLAGGGGQQSAAFAVLGAKVTVFDLSAEQLERDLLAASHYGVEIKTVQGDMRDLSRIEDSGFDIVHHAYSINFVPDAVTVFREVARVLRRGGIYQLNCANPFGIGVGPTDWNGKGYVLKNPYSGDRKLSNRDQSWVYDRAKNEPVPKPIEYRHSLSDVLNGLINTGFLIIHADDNCDMNPDEHAEPGSWNHFVAFVPPWFSIRAAYRPDFKI